MTAYKYIVDTGTVSVDASTLLAEVQGEFKVALGASLDLDPSTPQGTLITAEVLARTQVMRNNSELANMTNPNLAYGTFLDAIGSLLGITRGSNSTTIGTPVKITGNSTTVIPAGSRVQTEAGDVFVTVAEVSIPISGEGEVVLASEAFGKIPLPVGDLTIVDGTVGWGTATVTINTTVTLGSTALTDAQFKNFREITLAQQGIGSSAAVAAELLKVDNVKSVNIVENNTGAAGLVNGITFSKAAALWVCVSGTATSSDIAAALYRAHSAGCAWDYGQTGDGLPVASPNGTEVIDPTTGMKYRVKWTTPILFDCYVQITVSQATSVFNPEIAVRNAIIAYADGSIQGEQGFVIGASISSFELAGAVSRQLAGLYTKSCYVACVPVGDPPPNFPADYSMEWTANQFDQAVVKNNNITVTVV